MKVTIITIFPDLFKRVFDFGIIARACKREMLQINLVDLRKFGKDIRGTVDDRPYGGGEGMVLKPEPIFEAVESCQGKSKRPGRVVLLSPQGMQFNQNKAKELSLEEHIILICGRYEGVDQRVVDYLADEEISVGDFVLSGGEFAALLIVDSVTRLLPGTVGKGQAILEDSFMNGLLDYPNYTRPAKFRGWDVPEILLSGDHRKIEKWREQQALECTQSKRPDLLT